MAAVGLPLASSAWTAASDAAERSEFYLQGTQQPFFWKHESAAGERNKSYYHGVQLGVQTYSFHEIPNGGGNHADRIIRDMLACGIYDCELFGPAIEPTTLTGKLPPPSACPQPLLGCSSGNGGTARNPWGWEFAGYSGDELKAARARQRKWRETTSIDYFTDIRKKFNSAGINIFTYNPLFPPDSTDLEADRIFEAARALGAKAINLSTTFTVIKRLVPFAEKHQMVVAPHGHSATWDPEEFSTKATFERAFALSKWVGANLDIGHYVASGGDPIEFINQYHDRITNLHLKDRKRNHPGTRQEDGASVPWGHGDTPIKQVLLLLQQKRYAVPAFIEYEHAGGAEPVEVVKQLYQYCKDDLKNA